MLKYKENIYIDPDNPFKNDALDREENIKSLTNIIEFHKNAAVMAINSPWGTGKTTFIKMWKAYLENNNFNTLYFNAWENDFVEEPFIAFISEFEEILTDKTKLEKFQTVSKEVVKGFIPAIVKLGTSGILDLEKVNFGDDIENVISTYSEKIASEQIKNYKQTKNAMAKFREVLTGFVEEQYKKSGKPIILFVDELDRCRPNFAIQLLEKLKHLFYIDGLIFILAVDKNQLSKSIKVIYGNEMDTEGYLARFIDFEYILPNPENNDFVAHLINKYDIKEILNKKNNNNVDFYIELTKSLITAFDFSLRVQEKLFSRLFLILCSIESYNSLRFELLLFLMILRYFDYKLYIKFREGNINYEEMKSILLNNSSYIKFEENDSDYSNIIDGLLIYVLKGEKEITNLTNRLNELKRKDNLSREEDKEFSTISRILELVNHYKNNFRRRFVYNEIRYIKKKIEIIDDFTIYPNN
ncbi:KAP family P-loop NTPase fold protein [Selenihalanaerobacter shriftii]|uniref:KAP family P-loop domain-containing protein n=1 Tax=Selenihalanaerobacter shriftii TaxID=142842 RepID=A0A1T4Q7Q9_9FIRM|nr:P-loop NTPase fold protein [Selenihalanaerobacter shriftii]SJZ99686.1 KAP family P-loop domain-containing protein [Selenihalanaerobacter shriftii]